MVVASSRSRSSPSRSAPWRSAATAAGPVARGIDGGIVIVDGGGGGTDSGIVLMRDGGTGRDGGGTTGACGPGLPACPGGTMCVDGSCVPTTGECTDQNVPYNVISVCSPSTMTCIGGCADGACIQSCLDADPSPDCSACINQNFISCANDHGCQSGWTGYVCCLDEACGTDATAACIMSSQTGACASPWDGYNTCLDGLDVASSCPTFLQDCF